MSTANAGRIPITAGTIAMGTDIGGEDVKEEGTYRYEKEHRIVITSSIIREKIKQFKLGKYTDKYIRTYLEFVLMEGIIDNLSYLEYLKEIGEKT